MMFLRAKFWDSLKRRPLYLILLLFSLIVFVHRDPAVLAAVEEQTDSHGEAYFSSSDLRTYQENGCQPGTGWQWTNGPSQSEVAAQVQQALSQVGIEASIEARSYGEIDNCGTFRLFGIDFTISIAGETPINDAGQQRLADTIYPVLVNYGKPNLGNAKITFPQGGVITLNDRMLASQLAALNPDPNWQQITTTNSPQGRYTHGFAYDSGRQVAVLFGGDNTGYSRLNDTWEYDGTDWQQADPVQSPAGRVNIDQALVYDSSRQRTVLFGGLGGSEYLNDTWEYDGTTWLLVSPGASPAERDSHAMAFDSDREVTVMFGGYGDSVPCLDDTWEYNGTWQQVLTSQTPAGRFQHAMVYDEVRHVMVLFGGMGTGNTILGDTWEYDGATWRQITPLQSPPERHNHSMVYDRAHNVVILYGGDGNSGLLNDTWEFDGTTWLQVSPLQAPSSRTEMSMVYDLQRGKILLFGGGYWSGGNLIVFNDTWEYGLTSLPPGSMNKKVYVIIYNPLLSNGQTLIQYMGWNDPALLTQGTIDFFMETSENKVNYTVVDVTVASDGWPEKVDGFRYTEQEYLEVLSNQHPPHTPDNVNYNLIVNAPEFDICGRVNRGEIDEVWIYNGPYYGFYESTLVGPGAYWYNSPPVPGPYDCNRLVPIMGPSPERGLAEATENFGHRTESTMMQVYGSWMQDRTAHNWERFALVKAHSRSYSYSGCGNIHFPPNGTSDYDYGNPSTVLTNCDDFANYPNLGDPLGVSEPVTCSAWNCSHLDYFRYWFSHFPSNAGCGPDNVANNWWLYFANPALALNPPTACQNATVFLPLVKK